MRNSIRSSTAFLVLVTVISGYANAGSTIIPFTANEHNNIVVRAALNGADSVNLMLHTASSDVTLTEEAVAASSGIVFTDTHSVKSWGGESDSRVSVGNDITIGSFHRDDITIWEDKNSGVATDGKFGWDFFQGRMIEIDFARNIILTHDSLPAKAQQWHRLDLDTSNGDLLFVEAELTLAGQPYKHRFLVHSGYSGGLLLDDEFSARTGLKEKIDVTETSSLKDSFGNNIEVHKGTLPVLALGTTSLQDVPVGFFAGSVGTQKMSVMGMDVLRHFNLIFDLQGSALYISHRAHPYS
ncbi:hypothetical protein [Lysobacter sp. A421]